MKVTLLVLALFSAVLAAAAPAESQGLFNRDRVQLGPRPFFVLEDMSPSPL